MSNRSDELEHFKSQINLCEYAASVGFLLDRKASSRCSAAMRHSNGDKIVVARNSSRHWVYFNVHGGSGGANGDSGTIIDFVQTRRQLSLGEVRKELRPWIGSSGVSAFTTSPSVPLDLAPVEHDAAKVFGNWINAKRIDTSQPYLVQDRCIPSSILADPIFNDRIRTDRRSNVLFPHWDQTGSLCGFELKNREFTGFAPGGVKGLWCSRPRSDDQVMVLAETAIDALSVAAIYGSERKRFFSTAGQISPMQAACIRSAAARMPANAEIWLAFDNDDGGQKLTQQVSEALAELNDNFRKVVASLPPNFGDDWNDVLRNKSKPSLPRFQND